jgi:two-component system, NtrC family, response regulator
MTASHNSSPHILIIDDEPNFSESLKMTLEDAFDISTVNTLALARDYLNRQSPDAILIDVRLPDGDGIAFLREIKTIASDPVIFVMTAYATVNNAIDALKHGAVDYFTKPIDIEKLKRELHVYLENRILQQRIMDLDQEIKKISPPFITSGAGIMKPIIDQAPLIAPLDIPVLLVGETGTGKEKLAQWIHSLSGVKGDMVVINCSALSKDIIESELFGHTRGAFSGATSHKEGLIERADGGTLFLDEIGELPEGVQAKFLRILENRSYYRVGDAVEHKVTFRLISATHIDLADPINRFRKDLFFRINGVSFELPPLYHRKEDIPLLVSLFIDQANLAYKKDIKGVTASAMKMILAYHWPGNIRELKWAIHRVVATTSRDVISEDELSFGSDFTRERGDGFLTDATIPFLEAKENLEKEYIKNALAHTQNNKTEAAKMLGISARAIHYKITKYKIL